MKRLVTNGLALLVLVSASGVAVAQSVPAIVEAKSRVVLSAEADGTLTKLSVATGDIVKKGQLLANVFTGHLGLERKGLNHSLAYKKAEVENLSRLNQRGLSTDEELARAKMERNLVATQIQSLSLKIARSAIRAPFNAKVVRTLAEQHEWVQAGQPVVEILDIDNLRIVANLPSSVAVNLNVGDQTTVSVRDLGEVVKVSLASLTPAVDEKSNTVMSYWDVPNPPDRLLAGMKGELSLRNFPGSTQADQ